MKREVPIRVGPLIALTAFLVAATTFSVLANRKLDQIQAGNKRIETRVVQIKPVCAAAELRSTCETLLRGQPSSAVERICRITASILREKGIAAVCLLRRHTVYAAPALKGVTPSGGGNPHPSGLGGPGKGPPGTTGPQGPKPLVPSPIPGLCVKPLIC